VCSLFLRVYFSPRSLWPLGIAGPPEHLVKAHRMAGELSSRSVAEALTQKSISVSPRRCEQPARTDPRRLQALLPPWTELTAAPEPRTEQLARRGAPVSAFFRSLGGDRLRFAARRARIRRRRGRYTLNFRLRFCESRSLPSAPWSRKITRENRPTWLVPGRGLPVRPRRTRALRVSRQAAPHRFGPAEPVSWSPRSG
jgi:hypothetical protein